MQGDAHDTKKRVRIPRSLAAQVLFASDRTCCVCRLPKKPVQIHHIDDDPSHNEFENLAVLCLECHRETQLTGGFDRKLDADQVTLYRDDWIGLVAQNRLTDSTDDPAGANAQPNPSSDMALITDLAHFHRERGDDKALALLYARIGNSRLRDQYVDRALEAAEDPGSIVLLRRIQGRLDLVPEGVMEDYLAEVAEGDWTIHAQLLLELGQPIEAADSLLRGCLQTLEGEMGSPFTTAYYLKHLGPEISRELFLDQLRAAEEEEDLWWQVRAMEELGWRVEADTLLRDHAEAIRQTDDDLLKRELARAQGDSEAYRAHELRHQAFRPQLVYEDVPEDLPPDGDISD